MEPLTSMSRIVERWSTTPMREVWTAVAGTALPSTSTATLEGSREVSAGS